MCCDQSPVPTTAMKGQTHVDGLRIIAHHAHIFMCRTQQFDHLILRGVGILVLIDEDVFEFMLVFVKRLRKERKQLVKLQQQIVKIHRAILETPRHISFVDLRDGGAVGAHVFLLDAIIIGIILRIHQGVFGR